MICSTANGRVERLGENRATSKVPPVFGGTQAVLKKIAATLVLCSLMVSDVLPSTATYFDSRFITVDLVGIDAPLTEELKMKIRHHRIKQVVASENAPSTLFDDPTLFPHLDVVTISCSSEVNDILLRSLAKNYNKIRELTIVQTDPLISLLSIPAFRRLQYLDLECDLATESQLAEAAPKELLELGLGSAKATSWNFPQLSKLRILRIWNAPIDGGFLNSLTAPCGFSCQVAIDSQVNGPPFSRCGPLFSVKRASLTADM